MSTCNNEKLSVISVIVVDSVQVNSAASSAATAAGRNAIVMSLMVCCGFVVCWSPNSLTFFVNYVGYRIDFAGWFYHFTVALVFTNSCINPFTCCFFSC